MFMPVLIGLGLFRLIRSSATAIYFVMWKFPPAEITYSLKLLNRPPVSILHQPIFTYRKFFWDILRFLCFPLWLVLLVIRGLLMFLYYTMAYTLSGIRWTYRLIF